MLFEIAVGDAYGAGYEYVSPKQWAGPNDLSAYRKHPRHGTQPGEYTDDTQMSIAIAEALLSGEPWTPLLLARRFVGTFKRHPIEGYAQGFHALLTEVRDGDELLERLRPDSDKSGAAMRACPLGLLPDVSRVLEYCRLQAAITHNTPDGIRAACVAALLTYYLRRSLGPRREVGNWIEQQVPGPWSSEWKGKVGRQGCMSVQAAITAVTTQNSLGEILKQCINYTGDVDTVAAIAMGAASCSPEIAQDLPADLVDHLRDHPFGRRYLQDLDRRLFAAFPV